LDLRWQPDGLRRGIAEVNLDYVAQRALERAQKPSTRRAPTCRRFAAGQPDYDKYREIRFRHDRMAGDRSAHSCVTEADFAVFVVSRLSCAKPSAGRARRVERFLGAFERALRHIIQIDSADSAPKAIRPASANPTVKISQKHRLIIQIRIQTEPICKSRADAPVNCRQCGEPPSCLPSVFMMVEKFLVRRHGAARGFLFGMTGFVGEHFFFARRERLRFGGGFFRSRRGARPRSHCAFPQSCRQHRRAMKRFIPAGASPGISPAHRSDDATTLRRWKPCSRSAAMPAGADERFLDVRLAHAERGHARGKLAFFFEADGNAPMR